MTQYLRVVVCSISTTFCSVHSCINFLFVQAQNQHTTFVVCITSTALLFFCLCTAVPIFGMCRQKISTASSAETFLIFSLNVCVRSVKSKVLIGISYVLSRN